MAITTVATGDSLIQNVVSEKLLREAIKESYFSKFTDETGNTLVHRKRDLTKGKGDKITVGIRMKAKGAGVGEGERLKGKEESLVTYSCTVTLAQRRHAVSGGTTMDEQRAAWDIPMEAEAALKDWASEYIDQLHFTALLKDPTKILYLDGSAGAFSGTSSASTAKTAMHATNSDITPAFISACKNWAKTGGNRAVNPLRPIKVEGGEYYVMLVSPNVGYDLRQNNEFYTALKDAEIRGKDNPLFQGATAIWDGVVIHTHENLADYDNGGGASVHYNVGAFMGAQALIYANGEPGKFVKESDDYDNEYYIAWGHIGAVIKPTFNTKDYGSFGVYLACSNVTGK